MFNIVFNPHRAYVLTFVLRVLSVRQINNEDIFRRNLTRRDPLKRQPLRWRDYILDPRERNMKTERMRVYIWSTLDCFFLFRVHGIVV